MKLNFPKTILLASVIAGSLFGNCALAADKDVSVYGQLDALRSQNAVLTEALKNAELKNKLLAGGKATPAPGNASAAPARPMSAPVDPWAGAMAASSAQVQMVSGTGNNLVAVISMANGSRVNAHVGTAIPGVGVVQSISLNEVVVASKKQTLSVPFAADSQNAPSHGGAASPVSYPASPSIMQMPPLPPSMQTRGSN